MIRRQTVLVVCGEEQERKKVMRALRSFPHEVVAASGGEEALDILGWRPADLVLADEQLADMSGVDLLRQVRDRYPGSIRMLLSGSRDLKGALQALNRGEVHRFLTRPCADEDLRTVVRLALQQIESLHAEEEDDGARSRQRQILSHLEAECPGITFVERDESGAIVISPDSDGWPPEEEGGASSR